MRIVIMYMMSDYEQKEKVIIVIHMYISKIIIINNTPIIINFIDNNDSYIVCYSYLTQVSQRAT